MEPKVVNLSPLVHKRPGMVMVHEVPSGPWLVVCRNGECLGSVSCRAGGRLSRATIWS